MISIRKVSHFTCDAFFEFQNKLITCLIYSLMYFIFTIIHQIKSVKCLYQNNIELLECLYFIIL